MEVRCVTDVRAMLGESPVWSETEQAVYWIDILSKHLHRTDPASGQTTTWEMPSYPGMIARRRRGGFVVALQDGLYGFDPATGDLEKLLSLEADIPDNRPNDGKPDAEGRLWLGTMNVADASQPTGSVYRIDADLTVTRMIPDYRIPNGLTWSPDNSIMYHTDTRSGVVHKYAVDRTSGALSGQEAFFTFDRQRDGGVDGAGMDRAGGYWAAYYGGWKLARTLPTGGLDTEIRLPVSQPTMPAFGGPDGKTLFVTSARQNLSDEELGKEPLAGALLAVQVSHRGHGDFAFAG